jgi:outer membrane protein
MKLRPLNLSLVLATLLGTASGAQAQNLLQMYEAAKNHDAAYASARAQAQATAAKAAQAKAALLPQIGMSVSSTKKHADVIDGTSPDYTENISGISATMPLFSLSSISDFRKGRPSFAVAEAQQKAAEQDLIVRAAQAYFDVLTSAQALNSVQAQKVAVSEQLAAAKRNFEVGTKTIVDTHQAQAQYDLVLAQELVAQNDLRTKKLALDQLVGSSNMQPEALKGNAALRAPMPADVEQWVATALENNAQLRMSRLSYEIARLETQKQNAGHLPTLDLTAKYGENRFTGTSAQLSSATKDNDARSVGVTLTIPLFAGFAVQNKVKEAVALEEKARSDMEAAQRAVEQGTRSTYFGLLSGLSQVKALEAAQASAQSVVDATKLGYQVGVNTNVDVLNSQTQLYQTQRDLAKARYDVLVGQLKLRQAAGTLQAEDLQAINQLLAP